MIDDQSVEVAVSVADTYFGGEPGAADGFIYGVRRLRPGGKPWRFGGTTFGPVSPAGSAVAIDAGRLSLNGASMEATSGVYSLRINGGDAAVGNTGTSPAASAYTSTPRPGRPRVRSGWTC